MNRYFVILSILLLVSCEEQMIPIPDPVVPPEGRVVLIEELTGVECVPCFEASAVLRGILDQYDGAVVAYGIHGDLQSTPLEDSKYDFRYPDAESLELSMSFFGKPSAAFNRIRDEAAGINAFPRSDTWQGLIDIELIKPHVANVFITSNYNASERRVDMNVRSVLLREISGNIDVHVVISESHLIDAQKSPQGTVKEFEHEHVMKESLTGLSGQSIGSDISADEPIDMNFSFTIPDEVNGEWIPENMEITAFITSDDMNGEVLQAAQEHIIP